MRDGKAPKKARAAPAARKVGKSAGKDPAKAAAGKAGRAAQGPGRTPGSGRKAGTPNKRTLELRAALEAAGLSEATHPIVMMYRVYTGEITMPVVVRHSDGDETWNEVEDVPLEPALRVRCMAEVAQYLEPKRKAVEVANATDANGEQVAFLVDSTASPGWLNSEQGKGWLRSDAGQKWLAARGLKAQ